MCLRQRWNFQANVSITGIKSVEKLTKVVWNEKTVSHHSPFWALQAARDHVSGLAAAGSKEIASSSAETTQWLRSASHEQPPPPKPQAWAASLNPPGLQLSPHFSRCSPGKVCKTEGLSEEETMLHVHWCLYRCEWRYCNPWLSRLRNLGACAMSGRTDTATKGTLLPFSSLSPLQQICNKEKWIWMLY